MHNKVQNSLLEDIAKKVAKAVTTHSDFTVMPAEDQTIKIERYAKLGLETLCKHLKVRIYCDKTGKTLNRTDNYAKTPITKESTDPRDYFTD